MFFMADKTHLELVTLLKIWTRAEVFTVLSFQPALENTMTKAHFLLRFISLSLRQRKRQICGSHVQSFLNFF